MTETFVENKKRWDKMIRKAEYDFSKKQESLRVSKLKSKKEPAKVE